MFVESYGRVAVRARRSRPASTRCSTTAPDACRPAGFAARSAFLTSPTFGGDQLAGALHAAVRAVGRQPAALRRAGDQPRGSRSARPSAAPAGAPSATCRPTRTTGRRARSTATTSSTTPATSGYAGPRFGYPTMPDQYTLDAFHRLELARHDRAPGDGRDRPGLQPRAVVADAAPGRPGPGRRRLGLRRDAASRLPSKTVIWRSPARVRAAYGQSIEYSLRRPGLLRPRPTATRTWCWWCSATTSRRPIVSGERRRPRRAGHGRRPRPGGAATGSPAGAGSPGCGRARTRRCGGWTRFRDRFLAGVRPVTPTGHTEPSRLRVSVPLGREVGCPATRSR